MDTTLPRRDAIQQAVLAAQPRLQSALASDRFAAKIRQTSAVASKCEEFNMWHAASDNVTESGVNAAWGSMVQRVGLRK